MGKQLKYGEFTQTRKKDYDLCPRIPLSSDVEIFLGAFTAW